MKRDSHRNQIAANNQVEQIVVDIFEHLKGNVNVKRHRPFERQCQRQRQFPRQRQRHC